MPCAGAQRGMPGAGSEKDVEDGAAALFEEREGKQKDQEGVDDRAAVKGSAIEGDDEENIEKAAQPALGKQARVPSRGRVRGQTEGL